MNPAPNASPIPTLFAKPEISSSHFTVDKLAARTFTKSMRSTAAKSSRLKAWIDLVPNASGGPVGVGTSTAKSMVLNIVLVTLIGMLGTQVFWGANPRAPIGG